MCIRKLGTMVCGFYIRHYYSRIVNTKTSKTHREQCLQASPALEIDSRYLPAYGIESLTNEGFNEPHMGLVTLALNLNLQST